MRDAVESRVIRVERGLGLFGVELRKARLLAELAEQRQQQFLQAPRPSAACSATLHVTARDACSNALLSGVALTATGPGTTVTGTTNGSGVADLVVNAAGSWSVQGVKSGYTTGSVGATAACGSTTNVSLPLTVTGQVTSRTIHVVSCTVNLPGATVDLILSGVTVATGTTNASGLVTFSGLAAGTYTARAAKARLVTTTSAPFAVTCSTTTPTILIGPSPATGYACLVPGGCADPAPTTLYLTDPVFGGPITLTYNGSAWVGCQDFTLAGVGSTPGCVSGTRTTAVKYSLDSAAGVLTISLASCTSGASVLMKEQTCAAFTVGATFTGSSTTTTACLPRALTVHYNANANTTWAAYYGTGARDFTISE